MKGYIYKVVIFAIAIIIVFEFTIGKQINNFNEKINIQNLSNGLYFLKLENGNTIKFLKK